MVPLECWFVVRAPMESKVCAPPDLCFRAVFAQLSALTEISAPDTPTHFDARTQSLAPIDRIWCSAPPWVLSSVVLRFAVVYAPEKLFRQGISDHAPTSWNLSLKAWVNRDSLPIPRRLFLLPSFQANHATLVEQAGLDELPPPESRTLLFIVKFALDCTTA